MKKRLFLSILLAAGVIFCNAQVLVNGSLENNFNGWQTIGDGTANPGSSGPLSTQPFIISNFGSVMFGPSEGFTMAQLANGGTVSVAALDSFAEVPAGTIQSTHTAVATYGGAIKQKFYGQAGQKLRFRVLFVTTEDPQYWDPNNWPPGGYSYDDFTFYTLASGTNVYAQKMQDLVSMWSYQNTFGSPASNLYNGYYAYNYWEVYEIQLPATDSFALTIGVLNCQDNLFSSGMLIDHVTLNGAPLLSDVTYNGNTNQNIPLAFSDFQAAYFDADQPGDTLCQFIINDLPASGALQITYGGNTFTPSSAMSFPWYSFDSLVYIPNTNFTGTDSFHIQASDCTDFSNYAAVILHISPATSITLPAEGSFTAWPNPASDRATFRFGESFTGVIELFDAQGRRALAQPVSSSEEATLDLTALSPGAYTYRLTGNGSEMRNGRLVIARQP